MGLRGVGAGFGLKGQRVGANDQVHRAQQVGQHMVGLYFQVVGLEFNRHMAVAQVVRGAHQVEGRSVCGTVADVQNRLWCGEDAHQRAVLEYQHIAAAHHMAALQEHAHQPPARVSGFEAALLAYVPVECDGRCAFEQNGGQAVALGDDFGGGEHRLSGRLDAQISDSSDWIMVAPP